MYDKMDSNNSSGESESESDFRAQESQAKVKKKKPGIIYLSSIPEGMNVSQTTMFFSEFGRVGRVFLQPDARSSAKEGYRQFTEGWVEFQSKKVAKRVADQLNNTQVGGKRRSKSYNTLWNIKYLPRFKWMHLTERLAYEQAVKQQRMRTEISQVKREVDQFKSSVSLEKKKKKKKRKKEEEEEGGETKEGEERLFLYRQKETDAAIRKRKAAELEEADHPPRKKTKKAKERTRSASPPPSSRQPPAASRRSEGDRSAFLKSVFGGGGGPHS